MGRLQDKTVIITGAAQGMGAHHARRFVAEGANVVIGDLQTEKGRALADELGARARFVELDVTDASGWDAAVNLAKQDFGGLHVLVNNAAIYFIGPVDKANPAMVRKLFDINLFGSWLGISKVVPAMRQMGGGSIINLSSFAGQRGVPYHGIYGASKWGIRGLTRTAAIDLGPEGIRVNAVLPGTIADTGMFAGESDELVNNIPLRRTGTLDDVSNLLVFLASDESSYITGADHAIDGGLGA